MAQDTLRVLGLEEAVQLAWKLNPRLQQLLHAREAARAQRFLKLELEEPFLSYYREGIPTAEGGGFAEQRWTLEQAGPSPLTAYFAWRSGSMEIEALEHEIEALRRTIKRDVKKAYTRVLFSRSMLGLYRESIKIAEEVLRTTMLRLEAGEATELDRLKADLQLATARNQEARALQAYHAARYALFEQVGLPPAYQRYDISFTDTLRYRKATFSQEGMLQRLSQQPLMQAQARMLEAARLRLRAQQYQWLPAPTVSYYRQDYGDGYHYYGFLVGVRLPLFSTRSRIQEARSRLEQERWLYQEKLLKLKRQAEDAWHGYEAARETIERFMETIGKESEELLTLTLEAYRAGSIDLLSLLDTQRTYLQHRIQFYEALRDYYLRLVELEYFLREDIVLEDVQP